MDVSTVVYISQKALQLTIVLSLPVIVATLVIGLLVAVFQAATQIQDQGLPTSLKLIVGIGVLLLFQDWISSEVKAFANQTFMIIAQGRRNG